MFHLRKKSLAILPITFGAICLTIHTIGCKPKEKDPPAGQNSGFPSNIENILVTKCATAGCHNDVTASGGLRLDNWQSLFDGAANGAVVIPYRPDLSSLMYFINNDPSRGPVAEPLMPYNSEPLSSSEYDVIRKWIEDGAPNKDGVVAFSDQQDTRQKFYFSQQACDEIGVVDVAKNVVMRSINIGEHSGTEAPHTVKVDYQGQFVYTCLMSGTSVYKIDAATDKIVGMASIGQGSWQSLHISDDGSKILVGSMLPNGKIVQINTANMTVISEWGGQGSIIQGLVNPHAMGSNKNFDTFYVVRQYGNSIVKFTPDGSYQQIITLDGKTPSTSPGAIDPHEMEWTPDYSKYFVTCQTSNDVRALDPHTNQVLKTIPVGTYPQEMAVSSKKPYLFVTCSEDANPNPKSRGSVYVINYNTFDVVAVIKNNMFQPHGVTVDDQRGILFVASRNQETDGPPPHHSSSCGGRNGFYQLYDINNNFTPLFNSKKYEVLPDPYGADTRFKRNN